MTQATDTTDHEERHPVEILAEEFSTRLRNGEHPTIEEYARNHPEHAELIRSVFPSIAMVERLSHEPAKPDPQPASHGIPDVLGDFQIVREIGRGGMGVVYEAVQRSLNRHVALKAINALVSSNSQHRARFRREAEAAASLHHTNIVPIYGIGEDHGLQYYAMQLIDGVTLQDIIDCLRTGVSRAIDDSQIASSESSTSIRTKLQFNTTAAARLLLSNQQFEDPVGQEVSSASSSPSLNARHGASSSRGDELSSSTPANHDDRTVELPTRSIETAFEVSQQAVAATKRLDLPREYYRNIARVVANIANALHYAHHQHVLHRDIKPANLLLDREGTLWITDFGLARRTDLDAATQTGEILGTLRYMAPEQLAGHGDSRVDIYSLGLTLYELLTLKPAIESPKLRLLDPQRHSVIALPRSINPAIPLDLQTIALKACAYAPEHRYQHAGDLEEDLRRFLEDRPILARRTSRLESLARWARRNPAIASLATVTMILLVSIAGLLAVWNRQQQFAITRIGDEYQRAEKNFLDKSKALEVVEREFSRAEANLDLSLKAFDKITANIAARGSTFVAGNQLEDLDVFDLEGAALSQADVTLLETLLEFFDRFSEMNDKDLRVETALAKQRMADIQHNIGKLDEAETSYRKSLEIYQGLHQQFPNRQDVLLSMITVYNELVILAAKRGQLPKTGLLYQEARRLFDQSPTFASSSEGRFALAKLLNSMGTIGAKFGRDTRIRQNSLFGDRRLGIPDLIPPQLATRLKRESELNAESLSLLKELLTEQPDNDAFSVVLARALKDEVRIAKLRNDAPRAEDALVRSIDIWENLCKAHPESTAFKYELAETLSTNFGMRPTDVQRINRSIALNDELLKENPDVPEYRALKASTLVKQSVIFQINSGRSQKSEDALLEAIKIQKELATRYSDIAGYTLAIVQSLTQLAELEMLLKKPDKAKEAMDEAIQFAEAFGKKHRGISMLKSSVDRLRERKSAMESRIKDLGK